jgi:hypothetical protein
MNNHTTKSARFIITIRWLARIIGTLSVAVFLIFFIADCVKKGTIAVGGDRIVMTVFMFLIFGGLLIAWKWERIGGTLALVCLIPFIIFAPTTVTQGAILVMTFLYGLPALLFVFCWWQTRKQIASQVTRI